VQIADRAVYSLHKTSTRSHVVRRASRWGTAEVIAEMKFDIPKMYKFHKKNNVAVEVDLIRVEIDSC
jgi:rRNA N6-adenosine-methyltransferase METTL5